MKFKRERSSSLFVEPDGSDLLHFEPLEVELLLNYMRFLVQHLTEFGLRGYLNIYVEVIPGEYSHNFALVVCRVVILIFHNHVQSTFRASLLSADRI